MSALPCRAVVAALAALVISLFGTNAAARLDGAGLFALPPERVAAAWIEPSGRAHWRLADEIRELVPVLEHVRDFGVTPMILGFRGFGVRLSSSL